jgi:outer membrane protein TolC
MNHKFALLWYCLAIILPMTWGTGATQAQETKFQENLSPLSVSRCIEIALEQNRKRRISKLAVETAQYQHKQALSSFWPQMRMEAAYNRQDEDVNFVFPENTYSYSVTMPGMGTIAGQTTVPEQDVTVMDRESILSSLNLTYPLFTGGLRASAVKAAESNIRAAQQAMRRTDLELVRDVQRMYYGAVLARRLSGIGEETLARLKSTTELTERLYKSGSGSVTKLDYLRSKVVFESARSIVERLTSNVPLAKAALGNTIGLGWETPFTLSEMTIPFIEMDTDLIKLVAGAYQFNPDWKRLAAGLDAARALVKKERSGYLPKVALNGTVWRWDNNLDGKGMATNRNEDGWRVGVGMQMPIFTGFMTTHKIKEAKARLKQMESRQILLKEGLALQVKHGVIRVNRSRKIRNASVKAADYAREHRELSVRAYMNELVSTEMVIESQVFEAIARAKSEMAQYENATARFDIDFVVGQQVRKLLAAEN